MVFIMINRFLRVPGGVGTVLQRITSSQPALTCLREQAPDEQHKEPTEPKAKPHEPEGGKGKAGGKGGGRPKAKATAPQIRRNQLQPPLHSPSLRPGPLLRRNSARNAQIWFGPLSLRRSGLL